MKLLCICLLCFINVIYASNFDQSPIGYHWYTVTPTIKHSHAINQPHKSVNNISPYQRLLLLRMKTKNILANALLKPNVTNTTNYMAVQQWWAKKDQQFVRSWQIALLLHPDLDYRLNFPTNNAAIPIRNDELKMLTSNTVMSLSKEYGLIVFYQGRSLIAKNFASILGQFIKTTHFNIISITTDGVDIDGYFNTRSIPLKDVQQRLHIQKNYMPAIYLVDLKHKKWMPLSYGFISLQDLMTRCLDVVTNFKRYSYKGLAANENE